MSKTKKKYYVLNDDVDPQVIFGQVFGACVDDEVIASLIEDFDEGIKECFHVASEEKIREYGTVDDPHKYPPDPFFVVMNVRTRKESGHFETQEEAEAEMRKLKEAQPDDHYMVLNEIADILSRTF